MITTKNRVTDLQRTLAMVRKLDPPPDEVLVTADGCTDETVPLIKEEMKLWTMDNGAMDHETAEPLTTGCETLRNEIRDHRGASLKLIVNEVGRGSVASRDRMMREAKGDLVLALDDDSYPEQLDCLHRLSSLFEVRPNLAIATFPQRTDEYPESLTQTDFGPERPVRSFPNSGAVLRWSCYLQLAGFEPKFFHMYEEPDYALQCVAAGYDVLFTPLVTIRHHYSGATRSELRNHHRHARNEFWSTLMRCPLPYALGMLAWRVFAQFLYACKRGGRWVVREPVWWWQALAGTPACLRRRQPVSWSGYRKWLSLKP
ncbi:MAG TPA: glycosyltransferase [Verrucomicrobiae bacterium]